MRSARLSAFSLLLLLSAPLSRSLPLSLYPERFVLYPDPTFKPILPVEALAPGNPNDSDLIQITVLEARRAIQFKEAYFRLLGLANEVSEDANAVCRNYNLLAKDFEALESRRSADLLKWVGVGASLAFCLGALSGLTLSMLIH